MTEDEHAIRTLVETWFVSSRRGDLATVLDLIADDAIFMVAGQPPFDKAAFAAVSRGAHAVAVDGLPDRRAARDGRLGVSAQFHRDRRDVAGRRSGHTLTIFRKRDGRWQLVRDANLVTLAQ